MDDIFAYFTDGLVDFDVGVVGAYVVNITSLRNNVKFELVISLPARLGCFFMIERNLSAMDIIIKR